MHVVPSHMEPIVLVVVASSWRLIPLSWAILSIIASGLNRNRRTTASYVWFVIALGVDATDAILLLASICDSVLGPVL
jgi:hypothetical protein